MSKTLATFILTTATFLSFSLYAKEINCVGTMTETKIHAETVLNSTWLNEGYYSFNGKEVKIFALNFGMSRNLESKEETVNFEFKTLKKHRGIAKNSIFKLEIIQPIANDRSSIDARDLIVTDVTQSESKLYITNSEGQKTLVEKMNCSVTNN